MGGRRFVFSSSCNARCILINGISDNSHGEKTRNGPGAKLGGLLGGLRSIPVAGDRNRRILHVSVLSYVIFTVPLRSRIENRGTAYRGIVSQ